MYPLNADKEINTDDEKDENDRHHAHHVEAVTPAECPTFEAPEHLEGLLIVLVADVGVGELGVKYLLGWDLALIHLLPAIHVLVCIHPLSHHQPHTVCLKPVELLTEADEISNPSSRGSWRGLRGLNPGIGDSP